MQKYCFLKVFGLEFDIVLFGSCHCCLLSFKKFSGSGKNTNDKKQISNNNQIKYSTPKRITGALHVSKIFEFCSCYFDSVIFYKSHQSFG